MQGVNDKRYADLEDSFQHQLAVKSGCEMLITFNLLMSKKLIILNKFQVRQPLLNQVVKLWKLPTVTNSLQNYKTIMKYPKQIT